MTDITGKKALEWGPQTIADIKSVLGIADEGNANDYFYLKTEVNALVQKARKSPLLLQLEALSTNIVAVPFGSYLPLQAAAAMNDGRAYTIMTLVEENTIVNYIGYSVSVLGDYTADNYNGLDVCELVDGNLVQLAKTINDGAMWKTAGYAKKTITPITLLPGHVYYIRAVWNASATVTAPSFSTWGVPFATIPNSTIRPAIYNSKADLVTGDAVSSYNAFTVLFGVWLEK